MKINLFLITFIGLLLLAGCKSSVQAPSNPVNDSVVVQEQIADDSTVNEPNDQDLEENEEKTDDNMTSQTISKEAYDVPEGTHIIEARKTTTGFTFFPLDLNIKAGETVRFVNAMNYLDKKATAIFYSYHTGLFRSPELNYSQYYDVTFTEPGNFTYNAIPYQNWFKKGTIVVE